MGDPVAPERPGGRDAALEGQAGIPAMPVIRPSEQVPDSPYPLLDGVSPTVGSTPGTLGVCGVLGCYVLCVLCLSLCLFSWWRR
jgi:hypothetical protein